MKTSIDHESKNARHTGYRNESLSVKDALIWFVITVVALCIAGTSQANIAAEETTSTVIPAKNSGNSTPGATGTAFSDNNRGQ